MVNVENWRPIIPIVWEWTAINIISPTQTHYSIAQTVLVRQATVCAMQHSRLMTVPGYLQAIVRMESIRLSLEWKVQGYHYMANIRLSLDGEYQAIIQREYKAIIRWKAIRFFSKIVLCRLFSGNYQAIIRQFSMREQNHAIMDQISL